jgi:hypothetical protein
MKWPVAHCSIIFRPLSAQSSRDSAALCRYEVCLRGALSVDCAKIYSVKAATFGCESKKQSAQSCASSVQPRHHRAFGNAHNVGDLRGEALDVGVTDCHPESFGDSSAAWIW